jgi:hypothetical protein
MRRLRRERINRGSEASSCMIDASAMAASRSGLSEELTPSSKPASDVSAC